MWAPIEPDGAIVRTLGPVHGAFAKILQALADVIPRALAAVLVLLAFWAIATLLRRATRAFCHLVLRDRTLENLATQVAYYTTLAVGLAVAAETLGFSIQTLVAGLGLTGLALGIALKDVISNFVSGLLLLWLRPFAIGDQIVAGEMGGTVERIKMRATQIRTYDGCLALVPNTHMLRSRIINRTAQTTRRGSIRLHLGYDTPLERATGAILDATLRTEGVMRQPMPAVRVVELGSQAIAVDVLFWTVSHRADFATTESAVRCAVLKRLREESIALPTPELRRLAPHDVRLWRAALAPGVPEASPAARLVEAQHGAERTQQEREKITERLLRNQG